MSINVFLINKLLYFLYYANLLLGSALAIALVLGVAGCSESEDDGDAISGEKISYFNGLYYRAFASTKTKHYSSNATITIEDADDYYNEGIESLVVSKGVIGYVFGLEETTDTVNKNDNTTYYEDEDLTTKAKFYNFGIVAIRYNAKESKAQAYVSWCKNVSSVVLNTTNSTNFDSNVYDASGAKKSFSNVETEILSTWTDLTDIKLDSDKNLRAFVKVVANEGVENASDTKDSVATGSYTVSIYPSETSETASKTAYISAKTTGLTERTQLRIGRYVTAYPGQSISGTLVYSDIAGFAIPAEYED